MFGLDEFEATRCSGCGLTPHQLANPDDNVFVPDTHTCPGCKALAFYNRMLHAEHAKPDKNGQREPAKPHPLDGVRGPFLRPATPEEIERSRKSKT